MFINVFGLSYNYLLKPDIYIQFKKNIQPSFPSLSEIKSD